MPFSALTGNSSLIGRLARLSRSGQVPPSLLFTGPPGVGKLRAAITLAQAQNCARDDGDACGACPPCLRIERHEHPDVRVVGPEGKGGQIKIEKIREIVADAPFRPFEGRRRVSIVDASERMNVHTANAFLKTLEEPPPWLILVLVTENAAALPVTILSRCQTYRFAPLDVKDVEKLLVEQHDLEPDRAALLAALSGGSLKKALDFEQEELHELREEALKLLAIVSERPEQQELVKAAERLAKHDDLAVVLRLLVGLARDAAVTRSGGTALHRDLSERLELVARHAPPEAWLRAQEAVEQALVDIKERYLNKRITLNQLFLSLSRRAPS